MADLDENEKEVVVNDLDDNEKEVLKECIKAASETESACFAIETIRQMLIEQYLLNKKIDPGVLEILEEKKHIKRDKPSNPFSYRITDNGYLAIRRSIE